MESINIETLLAELFELDPSLKEHRKDLELCIQEILLMKPEMLINQAFKNELRFLLQQKIQANKKAVSYPHLASFHVSKIIWQNLLSGFGGAALATLVLAPSFYFYYEPDSKTILPISTQNPLLTSQQDAVESAPEAFVQGESLLLEESEKSALNKAVQETAPVAQKKVSSKNMIQKPEAAPVKNAEKVADDGTQNTAVTGGGNSFKTQSAPEVGSAVSNDTSMGVSSKIAAPERSFAPIQSSAYFFEAESVPLPEKSLPVFQQTILKNNVNVSAIMNALSLPSVNVGALQNASLEGITIAEEKALGLVFNLSADGSISFTQNWKKWEDPFKNCQTDDCYQKLQLKLSDVPSDAEIIAVAQNFVKNYKIDLSKYGTPVVDVSWKNGAENYVPDTINVIYPEMVNGKMVYEQSGIPSGVSVSVNIRFMKVSGMFGLVSSDYSSKNYESIQNEKVLHDLIKNGGIQNLLADETVAKKVQLSSPSFVFVKVWKYDEKTGAGASYYVPSYKFVPQEQHISPVFVPLVESFLADPIMTIQPVDVMR